MDINGSIEQGDGPQALQSIMKPRKGSCTGVRLPWRVLLLLTIAVAFLRGMIGRSRAASELGGGWRVNFLAWPPG